MSEERIRKEACPECRKAGKDKSGDNLVVYPEGKGSHCFACGYHVHGDTQTGPSKRISEKLTRPIEGEYRALSARKIDEKTCRLFGYRLCKFDSPDGSAMARYKGSTIHVSDYWKDGEMVAQHLRFQKPKDFRWRGEANVDSLPLYGQWLWSGSGKRIVITEGEIDCLTISSLQKNRWPVVSLPSGVQSSEASIRANLEFLSGYEEIVLCFDSDEPGRLFAQKCAEILPPGKARIAHLPMKDANDMLRANQGGQLLQALYEARSYQPDGILHVNDITTADVNSQSQWTFPWRSITAGLMGQRSGEMTLIASGTGSGKSTIVRELVYDHLCHGRKVGVLMLEETPQETLDDLISLRVNKPVRQIRAGRELNQLLESEGNNPVSFGFVDNLTDEEYQEAKQWFGHTGLYVYDHHGTNEFGSILQRVEYMAAGLGCDVIMIDHITAAVQGMSKGGSERESIDETMRTLRSIVQRTGVHIDIVSQLNRLDGKAAEEGGQITMNNLRGSGSLGSVPNSVIAIERNQQADDPEERHIIKVRSLKGRFHGATGVVGTLKLDQSTRRVVEAEWSEPQGESDVTGSTFDEELEARAQGISEVTA